MTGPLPAVTFGIYEHRKSTPERPKYYLMLIWSAAREADLQRMVVYLRLYPSDKPWLWVRSYHEFASNAAGGYGGSTPRFTRVAPWRLFTAIGAWPRGRRQLAQVSSHALPI